MSFSLTPRDVHYIENLIRNAMSEHEEQMHPPTIGRPIDQVMNMEPKRPPWGEDFDKVLGTFDERARERIRVAESIGVEFPVEKQEPEPAGLAWMRRFEEGRGAELIKIREAETQQEPEPVVTERFTPRSYAEDVVMECLKQMRENLVHLTKERRVQFIAHTIDELNKK